MLFEYALVWKGKRNTYQVLGAKSSCKDSFSIVLKTTYMLKNTEMQSNKILCVMMGDCADSVDLFQALITP